MFVFGWGDDVFVVNDFGVVEVFGYWVIVVVVDECDDYVIVGFLYFVVEGLCWEFVVIVVDDGVFGIFDFFGWI